jgi:hypothetical protein
MKHICILQEWFRLVQLGCPSKEATSFLERPLEGTNYREAPRGQSLRDTRSLKPRQEGVGEAGSVGKGISV